MTALPQHTLPLQGWRVLVTRARAQAQTLSDALRTQGAEVIELPAIEIVPAPPGAVDDAVRRLAEYDWVLFTSVNGVEAVVARMDALNLPIATLRHGNVGVIGRGTERRLLELGVRVDFVPEQFVAESMVDGLVAYGMAGKRVLLPRAELARDTLPEGLRAAGATVDVVVAYRTQFPTEIDDALVERARTGDVDAITFASPSTVKNLTALLSGALAERVTVVSIGPITSAALHECGWPVHVQADEYSIPGIVQGLSEYAAKAERRAPKR